VSPSRGAAVAAAAAAGAPAVTYWSGEERRAAKRIKSDLRPKHFGYAKHSTRNPLRLRADDSRTLVPVKKMKG